MGSNMKKFNSLIVGLFFCIVLLGCNNKTEEKQTEIIESLDENTIVFKGLIYKIIDVGGEKWLDRNLGASKACEDDKGDDKCWGDLYQWGRMADGHEKRDSSITYEIADSVQPNHENFIMTKIQTNDMKKLTNLMLNANWTDKYDSELWQADTKINNVCPMGWRVPTVEEFKTLNLKNVKDAFLKIKLSLNGSRSGINRYSFDGQVEGSGFTGEYWTSSIDKPYTYIKTLELVHKQLLISSSPRIKSNAVRCIKD